MANSDFSILSDRNQSSLVTAMYKEVSSFTNTFCLRTRVYIRNISKIPGSIYWLQDSSNNLAAFAFMDPNYVFKLDNIQLQVLGHTIAKKNGYMHRLLTSILEQKKNQDLLLICKDFVYKSFNLEEGQFIALTPLELKEKWSALAEYKTDYFGVKNETLYSGLNRKNQNVYLKLTPETRASLKINF
jgi:hypothetical protein